MNDIQQQHMFTPRRVRPPFGAGGDPEPVRTDDPASGSDSPDDQTDQPDQITDQGLNVEPAASGHLEDVPDDWITASVALERLMLAGLHFDGRKVRNLCSRNNLKNIKVKNERNQWQYFIDPQSLEAYIGNRKRDFPEELIRSQPDQFGSTDPDVRTTDKSEQQADGEKPDPAPSGQPDNRPEDNRAGEGELVVALRAQIKEQKEEIIFLREEVSDNRSFKRDLKDISSKMLDTFEAVATNRQIAAPAGEPEPATYRDRK